MKVIQRTVYSFDGRDYNSLSKVRGAVEDRIGAILSKKLNDFGPRLVLEVFDVIVKNRAELVELLSVEVGLGEDDHGEERGTNVLDIKD